MKWNAPNDEKPGGGGDTESLTALRRVWDSLIFVEVCKSTASAPSIVKLETHEDPTAACADFVQDLIAGAGPYEQKGFQGLANIFDQESLWGTIQLWTNETFSLNTEGPVYEFSKTVADLRDVVPGSNYNNTTANNNTHTTSTIELYSGNNNSVRRRRRNLSKNQKAKSRASSLPPVACMAALAGGSNSDHHEPVLDKAYMDAAKNVLRQQLTIAGLRLADVLNR